MMRHALSILVTVVLSLGCQVFNDSQLKGVVTGTTGVATDTVTGGGVNVDKDSGVWSSSGGYQLWWSANANQDDVLTNSPGVTDANMNVQISFSGALQAQTYQSTSSTGVCTSVIFQYQYDGTGYQFVNSGGADAECSSPPNSDTGTWSLDITDASAPHGSLTGVVVQDFPKCGAECAPCPCPACVTGNFSFAF